MEKIIDGAEQTSQAPSGENNQSTNLDVNLDSLDSFLDEKQESQNQPTSSDNKPGSEQLEIDPRFKDLPEYEGLIRTLQSKKDSLEANYNKTIGELEQERKYSSLIKEMLEDENLLYAFVNEVKPGLIPQKDLSQVIKERLKSKFDDENFRPSMSRDEAERTDPGGKDWQYYRLLDSIYKEAEGNTENQITSVKEYREKIKQQRETEEAQYRAEMDEVKTKLKMSDAEVKAVAEFGEKIKFSDLVKIHRFLRKFPNMPGVTPTNLSQVSGTTPGFKSEKDKFLDSIFG